MHTRRQQMGYVFEHKDIVKPINECKDWYARRFGGSSTFMPDIVATNNQRSILAIIEAKAGTGNSLNVDKEQIERCVKIHDMFSIYDWKFIVLAFKFMTKNKNGKRELKMYFYPYNRFVITETPSRVSCNYKGEIFMNRKKIESYDKNHTINDLIGYLNQI